MRKIALSQVTSSDVATSQQQAPRVFRMTSEERLRVTIGWVLFGIIFIFAWYRMNVSPLGIWNGFAKMGWLVNLMVPPTHGGWLMDYIYAMFETLAIAFLGTFLASVASLPLGLMGAKNIFPFRISHFFLRRSFDSLRGVDALIWALIFVNAVGLGPFAGVMAIFMSDTGTLSKLFAEAFENVDTKQVEGVQASGASRLQIIRFAVFPQVFPVLLSNSLYYFESNVRHATILGVVGAGGIGLQLTDRIRVNNWDEVSFIVILILITVSMIDFLSKKVRMRLIQHAGSTVEVRDE